MRFIPNSPPFRSQLVYSHPLYAIRSYGRSAAGQWEPAERGRMQCRKDFVFGKDWNGKTYRTKQVRPIFVEEADEIVVVTVYVYYF